MEGERLTVTVDEAARLLGIGRQLAYDRIKAGEIPALRIGRRLLVPRRALERLLENPQSQAQQEPRPASSGRRTPV